MRAAYVHDLKAASRNPVDVDERAVAAAETHGDRGGRADPRPGLPPESRDRGAGAARSGRSAGSPQR